MRILLAFVLIWLPTLAMSQLMEIGVFRGHNIQRIDFSYHNGSYLIIADGNQFGAILPNEFVAIEKVNNQLLSLKHGVKHLGNFKKVELVPTKFTEQFALRCNPIKPNITERRYEDGFKVFVGGKGLTVVNTVRMDNYLAGVVESEGGGGKPLEYYKAQAVISRTYALKHKLKHKKEGFHLCDQVHCQAYHYMLRYTPEIREAVNQTSGEFMVDTLNAKLVDGFFHANCGGQTSRTDYVWNTFIDYLVPFKDTFCIHTKQAKWEKRVTKVEWRNFLINNYHYPINDSIYKTQIYTFSQPVRKAFYIDPVLGIPLRDIRSKFGLRSTFFDCYPEGQEVVIQGKGYGHGIGLCQEGAMGMAKHGYNYREILTFYFDGIKITSELINLYFNQPFLNSFY